MSIKEIQGELDKALRDHERYETYVHVKRYRSNMMRIQSLKAKLNYVEETGKRKRFDEWVVNVKCHVCGQRGHLAAQCPKRGKPHKPYENVKCSYCGKMGHHTKVCWELKGKENVVQAFKALKENTEEPFKEEEGVLKEEGGEVETLKDLKVERSLEAKPEGRGWLKGFTWRM